MQENKNFVENQREYIICCQGIECKNIAECNTPDYNLCKECYNKKDLIILRYDERLRFQCSGPNRWLNKEIHQIARMDFMDICINTRRKDSMIKYCGNVTQIGQELCLVCRTETFPDKCQGLNCHNKPFYSDGDYTICEKCSKKKILFVNREEIIFSMWVNDETRWDSSFDYLSGNCCRKSKLINGVMQYCSNILPPNVDVCYACSAVLCEGVGCTKAPSIIIDDYTICEECSKKENLSIIREGHVINLWTDSCSRWSDKRIIGRCGNANRISHNIFFCTNYRRPKSFFCNACYISTSFTINSVSYPDFPSSEEDSSIEEEEIERWITKEQFLSKKNRGEIVCSYSPPRGPRKGLFCGNIYIWVKGNYTGYRCEECIGKVGRGKSLLEETPL